MTDITNRDKINTFLVEVNKKLKYELDLPRYKVELNWDFKRINRDEDWKLLFLGVSTTQTSEIPAMYLPEPEEVRNILNMMLKYKGLSVDTSDL